MHQLTHFPPGVPEKTFPISLLICWSGSYLFQLLSWLVFPLPCHLPRSLWKMFLFTSRHFFVMFLRPCLAFIHWKLNGFCIAGASAEMLGEWEQPSWVSRVLQGLWPILGRLSPSASSILLKHDFHEALVSAQLIKRDLPSIGPPVSVARTPGREREFFVSSIPPTLCCYGFSTPPELLQFLFSTYSSLLFPFCCLPHAHTPCNLYSEN